MRRAVDAQVGDFGNPPSQLNVQTAEAGRFAAQQSAQEVAPHILHARLHLALGLRAIWPAQPRRETPLAGEVQEDGVPDDLAVLVDAGPDGLHPVVENLLRNRAHS